MEVHMCVTEFLRVDKMALIKIHQCLLNIYEVQRVDVRTVRQWVEHAIHCW